MKKKAKKVPAKRRSAGPTKAAPFKLEVGGKYSNRQGDIVVRITQDAGESCFCPFIRMRGEVIKGRRRWNDCGRFWNISGVYHDPAQVRHPEKWRDLTRKAPKPPKKARKA